MKVVQLEYEFRWMTPRSISNKVFRPKINLKILMKSVIWTYLGKLIAYKLSVRRMNQRKKRDRKVMEPVRVRLGIYKTSIQDHKN